jgi:hypothetical protein
MPEGVLVAAPFRPTQAILGQGHGDRFGAGKLVGRFRVGHVPFLGSLLV